MLVWWSTTIAWQWRGAGCRRRHLLWILHLRREIWMRRIACGSGIMLLRHCTIGKCHKGMNSIIGCSHIERRRRGRTIAAGRSGRGSRGRRVVMVKTVGATIAITVLLWCYCCCSDAILWEYACIVGGDRWCHVSMFIFRYKNPAGITWTEDTVGVFKLDKRIVLFE